MQAPTDRSTLASSQIAILMLSSSEAPDSSDMAEPFHVLMKSWIVIVPGIAGTLWLKIEKRAQYSEQETVQRRDAVIKRMLATSPKPHSEMKLGKPTGKPSESQAQWKKKKTSRG